MTTTQLGLPLQTVCNTCPLNIAGRCEGAITAGSFDLRDSRVIGCYDSQKILRFLTDLRNVEHLGSQPSRHHLLSLPSFIPILRSGMPSETELPELDLYGVTLTTILNDSGNVSYRTPQALRRSLRLPTSAKLALLSTCNDDKLNKAWFIVKQKDLWSRIANLELTFATSFAYSVYDDDPRSDQIINQMKNFATHEYLCSLGVPSIPFLFFNSQSDLDFKNIIDWLTDRLDVTYVAMLAQSYKSKYEFERVLQQMRMICNEIDRPINFLIVGAAKAWKLRSIVSRFPTASIATSSPVNKGLGGVRVLSNLEQEAVGKDEATHAELIRTNIQQFNFSLDEIRRVCINPHNVLGTSLPRNFSIYN